MTTENISPTSSSTSTTKSQHRRNKLKKSNENTSPTNATTDWSRHLLFSPFVINMKFVHYSHQFLYCRFCLYESTITYCSRRSLRLRMSCWRTTGRSIISRNENSPISTTITHLCSRFFRWMCISMSQREWRYLYHQLRIGPILCGQGNCKTWIVADRNQFSQKSILGHSCSAKKSSSLLSTFILRCDLFRWYSTRYTCMFVIILLR